MHDYIGLKNKRAEELLKIKKENQSPYFFVEGRHLVEEALKNKAVEAIFEMPDKDFYKGAIKIEKRVFKRLSSLVTPDGVMALCKKKEKVEVEGPILVLDSLQDPGNVGTLFRSALSFSFFNVFLYGDGVHPYHPKVLMASQGAIFRLNVLEFGSDYQSLEEYKKKGYKLYATSLDADSSSLSLDSFDNQKAMIALGSEARGISEALLSFSDSKIKIPMKNLDSLNVGVAGGILMYMYQESLKLKKF